MKFKPRNFYRHRRCIDIDFFIDGVRLETKKTIVMIVRYWNRHYKFFQGSRQVVTIQKSDLESWSKL